MDDQNFRSCSSTGFLVEEVRRSYTVKATFPFIYIMLASQILFSDTLSQMSVDAGWLRLVAGILCYMVLSATRYTVLLGIKCHMVLSVKWYSVLHGTTN